MSTYKGYTEITTPKKEITSKALIENQDEYQHRYWLHGLFYEHEVLDYIKKNYKSGNIIDVGSCIGNHTLFFSKIAKNVYSFEPYLHNFIIQYNNISFNNLRNVNLFNCALGEKNKIVNIDYDPKNTIITNYPKVKNNKEYVVNYGNAKISSTTIGTKCILKCLDDFNIDDVSTIKIDVEGYELNVLKGAIKTIKKYKPDLYLEITDQTQLENILNFLEQFGYDRINHWYMHNVFKISIKK